MTKRVMILAFLLPLFAWAQSPFDGTWKINLSNAHFAKKPEVFALQNAEYTCSTCIPKIAVKADGADHKVPDAKEYDTLAVKPLDERSVQLTWKKDGQVVSQFTDTVSPDGKTLTESFKIYAPEATPIAGEMIQTRVSPGPAGAHAISGSWRTEKAENVSEHGLTFTLKTTAHGLSSQAHGESYEAKFDGKDYPVKGDRAGGTVSLKKVNDNTIEETYKQDGNPVFVTQMTVQGKTITLVSKNIRRGTTETFTANKQ